ELVLYAASAALSCLVLFAGIRHLDPNKDATKKALEHQKDIAKRLADLLFRPTLTRPCFFQTLFILFCAPVV
ncbi:hypothetical protein LINPERPRIM_LOCUS30883, partial [Linum perenne]